MRFFLLTVFSIFYSTANCQTWAEGNWNKEISSIKENILAIENSRSLSGLEDKSKMLSLIDRERGNYSKNGKSAVAFSRFIAAVHIARNAPGIENEPKFKSAVAFLKEAIPNFGKVDSYFYMRTVLIYSQFQSIRGTRAPLSVWKRAYSKSKADQYFLEAYANQVAFKLDDYGDSHAKEVAETLLSSTSKGSATRIYAAFTIYYVMGGKRNNKDYLKKSLPLIEKYYTALRQVDFESAKRLEPGIANLRMQISKM
ncbi:MAG: hypothetical protein KDC26_12060 [Armatimonadetes bacterium]|nr:hypothetical protein [Armatimonadota bacterium]